MKKNDDIELEIQESIEEEPATQEEPSLMEEAAEMKAKAELAAKRSASVAAAEAAVGAGSLGARGAGSGTGTASLDEGQGGRVDLRESLDGAHEVVVGRLPILMTQGLDRVAGVAAGHEGAGVGFIGRVALGAGREFREGHHATSPLAIVRLANARARIRI